MPRYGRVGERASEHPPARFEICAPDFHTPSTVPEMAEGEMIADLVATLGSPDAVLGSVGR